MNRPSPGAQPSLGLRERALYHQIHPLKLAVDVAGSVASTVLVWRHSLALGMAVSFIPSIAVTLAMLRWADLRRQKESPLGRYVAFHMTRPAEGVRFAGQVVIWIGAWIHDGRLIAAGALVIVFGWTYSLPRWRSHSAGR